VGCVGEGSRQGKVGGGTHALRRAGREEEEEGEWKNTGHGYFVSFAETHCLIVSLTETQLSIFGTVVCYGKCVTKYNGT
jgi:hypothetical protein